MSASPGRRRRIRPKPGDGICLTEPWLTPRLPPPIRSNSASTPARLHMWSFIDQLIGSAEHRMNRPDIAGRAALPSFRRRAVGAEPEPRLGSFLYLVCVALVAAGTISVFFGVGLYSLGHSAGGGAPSRAEMPGVVEVSLDTLATMTAPTVSTPASIAPGALGTQGGEPIEGRGDRHSEPRRFAMASSETVSGMVTQISDAMTWVVGNKTVHLWGIRPRAKNLPPSLEKVADWVRAKGPVECRKQAHSSRYRCSTSAGEDVAEAALLAGVARAADGATVAYRNAERQARRRGATH
jgi:hypothetical protein